MNEPESYSAAYSNHYQTWKAEAPTWLREAIDSERIEVWSKIDGPWKLVGARGEIEEWSQITKDDLLAVESVDINQKETK